MAVQEPLVEQPEAVAQVAADVLPVTARQAQDAKMAVVPQQLALQISAVAAEVVQIQQWKLQGPLAQQALPRRVHWAHPVSAVQLVLQSVLQEVAVRQQAPQEQASELQV